MSNVRLLFAAVWCAIGSRLFADALEEEMELAGYVYQPDHEPAVQSIVMVVLPTDSVPARCYVGQVVNDTYTGS